MKRRPASAGFSLAEISLALLVVSIGMLGLFALFPAGIQMSKSAVDDTRSALFAEAVFNGLRAKARETAWNQVDNITLDAVAGDMWKNTGTLVVRQDSVINTLLYEPYDASYTDYAVRYQLTFADASPARKAVRLEVLPGEGGGKAIYYYMELFNHGSP